MTDAENRVCIKLFQLSMKLKSLVQHRPILTEILKDRPKVLSDFHRRWLLELAWEHRDHLPADLRVIVALKRGFANADR